MEQSCQRCQEPFLIGADDLGFYDALSPVIDGKKYAIPAPTFCPQHRRQRRLVTRNERSYYKRSCDQCSKSIIGAYSPDKDLTVYCSTCWWGDGWEALDKGREFDFSRPFFDQFAELARSVPRLGVINVNAENSDYTSYGYQNKDCYLLSTCDYNEKCYYGCFVWKGFECVDCLFVINSKHCYQCIDCDSCYECQECQGCVNCNNCFGCIDSKNLKNCFGCVDLMNREFCFFNEQLSVEEYHRKVAEALQDREGTLQKIRDFAQSFPRRATILINCEDTVGDHLKNCKNMDWCFDGFDGEACKWGTNFPGGVHHCYDFDGGGSIEWSMEIVGCGAPGNKVLFSDHIFGSDEIYYSSYCINSKNLFGCCGLFNKQYCIFNQQYTKEEYEVLVPKIIDHMQATPYHSSSASSESGTGCEWGQFFPIRHSLYGYNETVAQQNFPMTKDDVLAQGWNWRDEDDEQLDVEKIMPADRLPDSVTEVPDEVLQWAIECSVSKKPFRLIPQELAFYRKYDIPVPHLHPEERHQLRMTHRNPQFLWKRPCDKCKKDMQTSYSPYRPEQVYCESCYLAQVY